MNRKILTATDGMVLTNGEIYAKVAYLAEGVDETTFYEITEEEYNKILEAQSAEELK